MSLRKLSLLVLALLVSVGTVAPIARASDDAKACHADADCGHGEHCKDGHCHS